MKKASWFTTLIALGILFTMAACSKSATTSGSTSLTASTTTAAVGQAVTVTLSSSRNTASWSVTPPANVTQTQSISTARVNTFTFNQAGTYRVGVRTRDIHFGSDTSHHGIDSCWHHGGGDEGHCHDGDDSASVIISVHN